MLEGYCFPRSAAAGRVAPPARLDRRGNVRRRGRAGRRRARGRLARRRRRRRGAPDPRRRRRERLRVAGRARDPDRRGLAQRLLRGDPHRRRRARRRVPRRAPSARRPRAPIHPRALDHHVERLQRLGRAEPVHGRHAGLVRATAGARLPRQAASRCGGRCSPSPTARRCGTSSGPSRSASRCGAAAPAGRPGSATSSAGPRRAGMSSTSRSARTSSSTPRCSTATACTSPSATTSTGHGACGERSTPSPHAGGNAAIFSGNTCFWQVRFDEDVRSMTCFKYRADEDPVVGTADEQLVTGPVERPAHRVARDAARSA